LLLIPPLRDMVIKRVAYEFVSASWKISQNIALQPKYYCQSGRELWRVGQQVIKDWPEPQKEHGNWFMHAVCLIWDFSPSYRYMGQDFFGLIDKDKLNRNPRKELLRVLDIFYSRLPGHSQYHRVKWTKRFVRFGFIISSQIKRKVKEVLMEADLEKLKMDEGDIYQTLTSTFYNFGGKSVEERKKIREEIDNN